MLYCSARCFLLECSSSSLTHPKVLKKKLQNEIMQSKAKQSKTNQKLKRNYDPRNSKGKKGKTINEKDTNYHGIPYVRRRDVQFISAVFARTF